MTTVYDEVCVWREPWQKNCSVYGGRVCNTLMADNFVDRTPLHDAALEGRLLPLKRLLLQGLKVDVVTLDGITPLHEACLGGHLACAKLLLEHGAEANAVTIYGATPLYNACCSGNPALLQLLLKFSSVHHPSHLRNSPLHEAAKRGYTECVELLISHDADANLETVKAGTPLYCACAARNTVCVQRLLILGADVNCGRGLDTPMHAAIRAGGEKEVALLLEHGADGTCRNSEGKTPLDLATDKKIQHLLQTAGPDSLSQLSRLCIRRTLGQRRLSRARVLYIPHILHDYILYQ